LREKGHKVLEIGEKHDIVHLSDVNQSKYDFFMEIDNGRGENGKLRFQLQRNEIKVPSAIVLIDSHEYPDFHHEVAKLYDHVFFAVWRRRDLFAEHPSAHWCPNVSDNKWFRPIWNINPKIEVGFFGSKGGIHRADILESACKTLGISCDIRQVGKPRRHRWPATAEAMLNCKMLFNMGQKHDGPNQRVMESMMCDRLLFNDLDDLDGMSKLFVDGEHYLGYTSEGDLIEKLQFAIENPQKAAMISQKGHWNVWENHQVKNRIDQILEVYNDNHR
jgi:hypothetical protein